MSLFQFSVTNNRNCSFTYGLCVTRSNRLCLYTYPFRRYYTTTAAGPLHTISNVPLHTVSNVPPPRCQHLYTAPSFGNMYQPNNAMPNVIPNSGVMMTVPCEEGASVPEPSASGKTSGQPSPPEGGAELPGMAPVAGAVVSEPDAVATGEEPRASLPVQMELPYNGEVEFSLAPEPQRPWVPSRVELGLDDPRIRIHTHPPRTNLRQNTPTVMVANPPYMTRTFRCIHCRMLAARVMVARQTISSRIEDVRDYI